MDACVKTQAECGKGNVAICDESALFYYLHSDIARGRWESRSGKDLFASYAVTAEDLAAFNTAHPLLGGEPVSVLAPSRSLRAHTRAVKGKLCTADVPNGSFFKLRPRLFLTTPELTFVRMGNNLSEVCLAEAGMNLCARYYLKGDKRICDRRQFITDPKRLMRYVADAEKLRGSKKALRSLRWVVPNSGSPMETKAWLQLCLPLRMGGFALPFTAMNYNVSDRRLSNLCEQGWYCIDLVDPKHKVGVEYDGEEYHASASTDNRRRNALKALGWEVFPIAKDIIFNPAATEVFAAQVARHLNVRIRKPKSWESRYAALRLDLGLPV